MRAETPHYIVWNRSDLPSSERQTSPAFRRDFEAYLAKVSVDLMPTRCNQRKSRFLFSVSSHHQFASSGEERLQKRSDFRAAEDWTMDSGDGNFSETKILVSFQPLIPHHFSLRIVALLAQLSPASH
jgi:hypothetical protein